MGVYTIELREFYNLGYELDLATYPIFNEDYRDILNYKIIQHFKYREIGYETAEMFKEKFELKMLLIMPVINELYKSMNDINSFLSTMTEIETYQNETSENNSVQSESSSDTDNLNISSDLPKNLLSIVDLDDGFYASSADKDKNKASARGAGTEQSLKENKYNRNVERSEGNKADILYNLRNKLYNVDEVVFEKLEPLFMGIW